MNAPRPGRMLLLAGIAALSACARDTMRPDDSMRSGPRVAGVVEITFENIGSPGMRSSALVAGSVAELEALRAARGNDAVWPRELTLPGGPATGRVTIQLDSLVAGSTVDNANGTRYIQSTYRVRNARATDSTAYDTPRHNLTFVAIGTAGTIAQTAVSNWRRTDGTNADPSLALQLLPSSVVTADNSGAITAAFPDALQVFTEAEVAAVDAPDAVTEIFPYGFIVRRVSNTHSRTLPASPQPNEYHGIVNFAFKIPLQPNTADNPTTVSVMMLALDDSDPRLTQSLEEQTLSARRASRTRASSLNVSMRNLLPGGTFPVFGGYRVICSVRTAGPAAAPRAHMINVRSSLISLLPDPYAADGSAEFIDRATSFRATFSAPVIGPTGDNLQVRGLQSGVAFSDALPGNGTNVVETPPASLFAGEEVEVVVTNMLACPQPQVARLRAATAAASGTLSSPVAIGAGEDPTALAAADLNNDHIIDVVVANHGSGNVSVLLGNGNGTFQPQQTFDAGARPSNVAIADLNDDGNADIVVHNQSAVSGLLGNGDGTFRPRIEFNAGGNLSDMVIGDVNGDGIPDIVVASRSDILVFLGDGDGTFPESESFSVESPFAIALDDLNTDGNLDIVATIATRDAVAVLLGNGDGTLQSARSFPAGSEPGRVAIADLNQDGKQDVVTANVRDGNLSVLIGQGDGTFQTQLTTTRAKPSISFGMAMGDLNGDSSLDVIVVFDEDELSVLLGRGDGTFEPETVYASTQANGVTVADVNRNGILDVLVANRLRAGTISLHLGVP